MNKFAIIIDMLYAAGEMLFFRYLLCSEYIVVLFNNHKSSFKYVLLAKALIHKAVVTHRKYTVKNLYS